MHITKSVGGAQHCLREPPSSLSSSMHRTARRVATRLARHYTQDYSTRQAVLEKNAQINAFVHIGPEPGPSSTPKTGPLADLKIAVKDNIATTDSPTTCSSAMLKSAYSDEPIEGID